MNYKNIYEIIESCIKRRLIEWWKFIVNNNFKHNSLKESKRWNLETLLYVSVFKGEAYKVIEHDINKDKRCDHKTTKGKPSYAVIFDEHP